jgi:MraZ protein
MPTTLLQGEYRRLLDERFRISIPSELIDPLLEDGADFILAKERVGALSLWGASQWSGKLEQGVRLVQEKMQAGRLDGRIEEVQRFGRLLSTRQTQVRLAGRGRLVLPEGFREFLGVDAGGEVLVVGAAVCIELWRPQAWFSYVEESIPEFRQLFDQLSS